MDVTNKEVKAFGVKFIITDSEIEVARAYLYVLSNNLHGKPFGFIEDVFVEEKYRSRGLGTKLINLAIEEARRQGCYKIVANSRHTKPDVHNLYERIGFRNHGLEFRIDFL